MSGPSRVDGVIDFLLSGIQSGRFPFEGQLPGEDKLAELSGASRLTVREAVKVLATQRVLQVIQGRGTYVAPVEEWLSIDALVRIQRGNAPEVLRQLFEVRAAIEVGAAERFAAVVTDEQLAELRRHLDAMVAAHAATDVPAMVAADWNFHQVILEGCQNPFIMATLRPLSRALLEARRVTSSVPEMRAHAIEEHGLVLAALESRDAAAARRAMRSHMRQTQRDTAASFEA